MKNNKKDSANQLLVSQLGSMLPYHTKVDYRGSIVDLTEQYRSVSLKLCRPYLRHLSSMTDDEEKEMQEINHRFCKEGKYITAGVFSAEDCGCTVYEMAEIMSYLNAHHFDYRGLIPMGLALEAPEDMYK